MAPALPPHRVAPGIEGRSDAGAPKGGPSSPRFLPQGPPREGLLSLGHLYPLEPQPSARVACGMFPHSHQNPHANGDDVLHVGTW